MRKRTLLLWGFLIMMFLAIWKYMAPQTPAAHVPYSDFLALLRADKAEPHVESVIIRGRKYTFRVNDPKTGSKTFKSTIGPPGSHEIAVELGAAGVSVAFEED